MDDLLREFLTETSESLDTVDNQLVRFEQEPNNAKILDNIFRLVHTIKGTCGFLGLPRLEALAHAAETLMGKFRDGMPVTGDAVTLILSTIDRLKDVLNGLEQTEAEPEGDDKHDSKIANQSIRVNVDTLESLMTMVSELVLTRNQLLEIARQREDSEFKVPLQRLSNVTAELQEGVMKTRMQPIGNAWQKLPRIVRDLSGELNKQIELEMHGADTELDRQVLDLIKDPLTHMVRNSADHGLETPAERAASGKPEQGTIRLSAYHEGGHIIICIADNGRGLNTERIKDTAVLRLRNKLLPLMHLKKLLKIDDGSSSDPENGFIVVTQVGSQTFGIVVDCVFHTEEIVVKPMSTKLRHIDMFSGNTILGDGAVIMIIDPNGIAKALGAAGAAGHGMADENAASHASTGEQLTSLLVFRAGSTQ